jgi:glycyl-tRNA synthetase beta chain
VPERGEFLLEIGCEEIPAPWLPDLTQQLSRRFQELAEKERLEPSSVEAFSTPRRLVLHADVRTGQADREEKVWGPSLKVARDGSGAWTGAAQGFAKKSGVRPEELQQAPKDPAAPDDLYLLALKKTAGRAAGEVLPQVLAALLRALAFPKRMSWDAWLEDGKGAFPFGRPIRWLVALLDGKVVPFQIHALAEGAKGDVIVRSGDVTYGHRFFPRGKAGSPVRVDSFDDLRTRLRDHRVVLEARDRDAILQAQLAEGRVPATEVGRKLVAEWRELVEWPQVVFGNIPEEFRGLPAEVLETVLVHHQKYVPIATEPGGRFGRFAAVINAEADPPAQAEIVRGMERVVVARLRDAAFFLAEDLKRPLGDRVADLAGVTFHRDLGSYREKADRMASLVRALAAHLGSPAAAADAEEAARLAKADLTTLMVREFPELQGTMGALYLARQGAPDRVAAAVRWHYHPVSVEEGTAPAGALGGSDATRVFAAVSLADKLDTLAGYFGLGMIPSGSSDPYGLRRAAQGAVRVLVDFWPEEGGGRRPSLRALVASVAEGYGGRLKRPADEVARDLEAFLLDRLRYVFLSRGFAADEVEAVLGAREPDALDDPAESARRLQALHRVRSEAAEDFAHLAVAFKRAKNILGDQAPPPVDRGLLSEAAERELFEAVGRLGGADGGYEARLRSLSSLRGPVDRFFDDVLVMAEDPRVRANRLGLLGQALSLFYRIADISKLGG